MNLRNNLDVFNSSNGPYLKSAIFTFNDTLRIKDNAYSYTNVEIISFAKQSRIEKLEDYSYPKSTGYTASHQHIFINNCGFIDPIIVYFWIILGLWATALGVHLFWTYGYKRQESLAMQKLMSIVPVFLLGIVFLDYVIWNAGPWIRANNIQYVEIVSIALNTVYNTLFVGFGLFVSRGWKIVKNQFEREELSRITLVVGLFYLVYSAFFIAADIQSLKVIIVATLVIMYLIITIFCYVNCTNNLKAIKRHIYYARHDQNLAPALRLKQFMMRWFALLSTAFFANRIIYTGMYQFITNNHIGRVLIVANMFIEFIIIVIMMVVLRTRSWMEYFTIELNLNEADYEEPIDIVAAEIPKEWMLKHNVGRGKSDMIINKRQVVKYKHFDNMQSIQAVLIDYSHTKWDDIPENDDTKLTSEVYSNTRLGVQEVDSDDSD